jgi:frataxin-like iron-binding protein CyaY
VKEGETRSIWAAVQHWCSIEEPGTYDLFCFRIPPDRLLDSTLINPRRRQGYREFEWIRNTSPILEHIPAILEEPAEHWFIDSTCAYANFRITVQKGTNFEQKAMAKLWIDITKGGEDAHSSPEGRTKAAADGIRYSLSDAFLDYIETSIDDRNAEYSGDFVALALRSTPESLEIFFRYRTEAALWAYSYLKPAAIPRAIPLLIDALTDQRPRVRAVAELQLTRFTKKELLRTWGGGYDCSRPTIEEARKMQPLWRKWWEDNKTTFKVNK